MNGIDIENEQISGMAIKIHDECTDAVSIMNYLCELREAAYDRGYKHGKRETILLLNSWLEKETL